MSIAGEYFGPDPTATFSGDISVSTAAQATGTLVAGDITVSLSSAFKAALNSAVGKANAACNLAKRDTATTCVIKFLKSQAKEGALLDYPLLEAVPDILQHVFDGSYELVKLPKTRIGENDLACFSRLPLWPSFLPPLMALVEKLIDCPQVIGLEAAAALGFTAWYLDSYNNHKIPNSFRYAKSSIGNIEKPPSTPTTADSSSCPTSTGRVSPYNSHNPKSTKDSVPQRSAE